MAGNDGQGGEGKAEVWNLSTNTKTVTFPIEEKIVFVEVSEKFIVCAFYTDCNSVEASPLERARRI